MEQDIGKALQELAQAIENKEAVESVVMKKQKPSKATKESE